MNHIIHIDGIFTELCLFYGRNGDVIGRDFGCSHHPCVVTTNENKRGKWEGKVGEIEKNGRGKPLVTNEVYKLVTRSTNRHVHLPATNDSSNN